MTKHSEVLSLTGLRGIAAIYVVFFHFFPVFETENALTRIVGHGYLAVDLFFVLSGFVMAMTYGSMFSTPWNRATYLKFLGRRIARVYPLYLLACIVALFLILMGWRLIPIRSLFVTMLSNLLMVQTWGISESVNLPAWSISAELAAYLVFPFLLIPTLFRGRTHAWLSGCVCAVAILTLALLPPAITHREHLSSLLDISYDGYALPVFRCLAEFSLGLLSYRVSNSNSGARLASTRFLATALCGVILLLLAEPRADVAVVLLFPLLLVALIVPTTLPARILASPVPVLLGNLSYSIYLIHGLLFELLVLLNHRANGRGLYHVTRYINSGAMLVILLLAWVVHRTFEVPARRWLRHLFEHGHEPAITAGI